MPYWCDNCCSKKIGCCGKYKTVRYDCFKTKDVTTCTPEICTPAGCAPQVCTTTPSSKTCTMVPVPSTKKVDLGCTSPNQIINGAVGVVDGLMDAMEQA